MNSPGPLGSRDRLRRLVHIALWTVLFYGLAAGIGKFLDWWKG